MNEKNKKMDDIAATGSELVPSLWKRSNYVFDNDDDCYHDKIQSNHKVTVPFTNHINNNNDGTPNKNFSKLILKTDNLHEHAVINAETCNDTINGYQRPVTPAQTDSSVKNVMSPITPTANLKMLISAISPELRNREKRKVLNSMYDNIDDQDLFKEVEKGQQLFSGAVSEDEGRSATHATNTTSKKTRRKKCSKNLVLNDADDTLLPSPQDADNVGRVSRKEKSLGLLCHKFISKYPLYPHSTDPTFVCLDEVAKELGVERRRIYDIVNVLESLEIVNRVAKNKYMWHGKSHLVNTLTKLKVLGESEGFSSQLGDLKDYQITKDCETKAGTPNHVIPQLSLGGGKDILRKDKSLGVMSQRFLMLFLVKPQSKTVNLDTAAKILIGEPNTDLHHSQFKTKIRRLYDIANVFSSLELIRKVHVAEVRGRKPAFKYIGPNVDNIENVKYLCSEADSLRPTSRHSLLDRVGSSYSGDTRGLTRHASFDQVCAAAERERARLYPRVTCAPASKDDSHTDKVYPSILPKRTNNQKHFILMSKGGKYELQAVNSVQSEASAAKVIYMSRPMLGADNKDEKKNSAADVSYQSDQDTRFIVSNKRASNGQIVLEAQNLRVPQKPGSKKIVRMYKQLDGYVNGILTPVSNQKPQLGKLVDACTQSSPQPTTESLYRVRSCASLKSMNENTPGANTELVTEEVKVRRAMKRTADDSGYESDMKQQRRLSDTTRSQEESETTDAEVAAFSQWGVKRKMDVDRRPSPLRALHLQPEFRESPSLVRLPRAALIRKDLSGDLDLASPLPADERGVGKSPVVRFGGHGPTNAPTGYKSPETRVNQAMLVSTTSSGDVFSVGSSAVTNSVCGMNKPSFIRDYSLLINAAPGNQLPSVVAPPSGDQLTAFSHFIPTYQSPANNLVALQNTFPLTAPYVSTHNTRHLATIKLVQPQQPTSILLHVPFSPPLTPTLDQTFTFPVSPVVTSSASFPIFCPGLVPPRSHRAALPSPLPALNEHRQPHSACYIRE